MTVFFVGGSIFEGENRAKESQTMKRQMGLSLDQGILELCMS